MFLRFLSIAAIIIALCPTLRAEKAPDFPKQWLNSSPLKVDGLKDKVIVMYFYEEDCPSCRKMWPGRLETAQKYQDKPVVFIAVNSGNAAPEVASYLKEVGCNWPTIIDTDRSFEKSALVDMQISLNNIAQIRVITPDGELVSASYKEPEKTIDQYLDKAKWKTDPADIPETVRPVWREIEIGNFSQAARHLGQAHSKATTTDKAALDKLQAKIVSEFTTEYKQVQTDYKDGKKWLGYKNLVLLQQSFAGLDEAKKLPDVLAKMKKDPDIIRQLTAIKKFEDNLKLLNSANAKTQENGLKGMKKLADEFADTDAGEKAKKGLEGLPNAK